MSSTVFSDQPAWAPMAPFEIRSPTDFPAPEVYRGHDGVRHWRADTFERDLSVENVQVEVDDLIEAADSETVAMALRVLVRLKRFVVDHQMRGRPFGSFVTASWCAPLATCT
jgi:hypothetical protein